MTGFLDTLARRAFGRTMAEAHEQGICIRCASRIYPRTLADRDFREYCISGLCPRCFDIVMGPEGDAAEPDTVVAPR